MKDNNHITIAFVAVIIILAMTTMFAITNVHIGNVSTEIIQQCTQTKGERQ